MRNKNLPYHLQIGAASLVPGLGFWLLEEKDRGVQWGAAVFGLIGISLILPDGRWGGLTFTLAYILWLLQIGLAVWAAREKKEGPSGLPAVPGSAPGSSYYEQDLEEDKAAWQLAREVAKAQLEPGERLLKALVGRNLSAGFQDAEETDQDLSFLSPFYCLALTQITLVIIALDPDWKPIDVTRIRYRGGLVTKHIKGWLSDELTVSIPGAADLKMEISDRYRKQIQATVEVLTRRGENFSTSP